LVPTHFRGTAVSLFNMGAGGLGNPVSFAFAFLILGTFGEFFGGVENSWRWFFALLALPALLALYLRRHLPESPRFLMSKGRIDEANRTLSIIASGRLNPKGLKVTAYLKGSPDQRQQKQAPGQNRAQFADVFRGRLLRNTTTVGISSFMSFGAQIAVLTLMPTILVSRGYSISNSLGFTTVMQLGSLLGTVLAAYLNYRFPRRLMAMLSGLLAAVFAIAFGLWATTISTILVFGFLFNFFVLYANTTIWSWAPELYPTRIRATGTSIIVNAGMLGQAAMPAIAGVLFSSFGIYTLFGVVAAMFGVLMILVYFAPETFGQNLEELYAEDSSMNAAAFAAE
jgi:putative MFS transporter